MLAKKCDRCGKLYEIYKSKFAETSFQINAVSLINRSKHEETINTSDIYDLCFDCMESLIQFLTDRDSEVIGKIKQDNARA